MNLVAAAKLAGVNDPFAEIVVDAQPAALAHWRFRKSPLAHRWTGTGSEKQAIAAPAGGARKKAKAVPR
jgi:hypothetical protein